MDITSKGPYPANHLSNFAAHAFVFDGVPCAGMEGLLQAFKFRDASLQREVCSLTGKAAKQKGQEGNGWRATQVLWWQGQRYFRQSAEYRHLLDRAYQAMFEQCGAFREALRATGGQALTHADGNSDPAQTVLTEQELVSRLEWLRQRMK